MLDHVTLGVRDLAQAIAFYDRALGPLKIERLYTSDNAFAGDGIRPRAFFWIGVRGTPQAGAHVAFAAPDLATVDAFHAAALAAGGRDNGAPGLRPHYHPITTAPSCSTLTDTTSKPSAAVLADLQRSRIQTIACGMARFSAASISASQRPRGNSSTSSTS